MPDERRAETVRRATAADIPAIQSLFKEVFGEERPEGVWRWKYFQSPFGSRSFVCESDGRLVAHCGGVIVPFQSPAGPFGAIQLVDFMSAPSHAGGIGRGGVFLKTAHAFMSENWREGLVRLAYGFPSDRHRLVGERMLFYRAMTPVRESTFEGGKGDIELHPVRKARWDLFDIPEGDIRIARDPRYLRWRYEEYPLDPYRFVQIRRLMRFRAEIAALVRIVNHRIWIMEIGGDLTPGNVRELATRLASPEAGATFWSSGQHPVARLMDAAGFRSSDRDHQLTAGWFRPSELWQRDSRHYGEGTAPGASDFYFTLGDYDVY